LSCFKSQMKAGPGQPRADNCQNRFVSGAELLPSFRYDARAARRSAVAALIDVEEVALGWNPGARTRRLQHQQVGLMTDEIERACRVLTQRLDDRHRFANRKALNGASVLGHDPARRDRHLVPT